MRPPAPSACGQSPDGSVRRATTRRATDRPAAPSDRGVRRIIGDDAKHDRRALGIDIGDRAQRRAIVGEYERHGELQARERHAFGCEIDTHPSA